ncbi:integrase [Colletotrichum camelliae]|nr:integrase [Colletotrichum camelliae]
MVNNATSHAITNQDPHIKIKPAEPASQFSLEGSYGTATFPGVLPDNGASEYSTAGQLQPTPHLALATPSASCDLSESPRRWFLSPSTCAIPPGLSFADSIAVSATRQLPDFVAFSKGLGIRLTGAFSTIANVCEHCQLHAGQPKRFRFTLRNDNEFNHEVFVWIIYLDGNRPVLHVVDSVTGFNAARFLKSCQLSTLRMLYACAGSTREFKRAACTLAITVKEVPVEAHHDISKVERYHATLRRAYDIICAEDPSIPREQVPQMTVKTTNDTAGPNGLTSALVVFLALSPGVDKRAEAVGAGMHAKRQVSDALALRNGPSTSSTLALPVQSDVLVWRENKGRAGPYKLFIEAENCTLDLPRGPRVFRSTHIKPFSDDLDEDVVDVPATSVKEDQEGLPAPPPPRRRGRPSKGEERPKPSPGEPRRSSRRRISKAKTVGVKPALVVNFTPGVDVHVVAAFSATRGVLLTKKERADLRLATQLRKSGKITTPGGPFEQSDKVAVKGLIDQDVIEMAMYDPIEHANVRISRSRMVEIKGKNTAEPHEKSRLVIQGYVDNGKEVI